MKKSLVKTIVSLTFLSATINIGKAQNIYTFAGNGVAGYSGDGGAAIGADLNNPSGIAIDASGNVYLADTYNNRIRKINTAGVISTIAGTGSAGFSGDGGAATDAELYNPIGQCH